MVKLITIILLCIYNIFCLYSQGFKNYALNKYSGGLTNEQNEKLNLAIWHKGNADKKREERMKKSRQIKLLQSQNNKEDKVQKLEKKQERLLRIELDNLGDANELYYEVYIEIISSLKKKIKKQNEFYDIIKDQEKNGELLFKQGRVNRNKISSLQDLKQQNEIKQKAVEKETEGLEILLVAMEGYYNLVQSNDEIKLH